MMFYLPKTLRVRVKWPFCLYNIIKCLTVSYYRECLYIYERNFFPSPSDVKIKNINVYTHTLSDDLGRSGDTFLVRPVISNC